MPKGAPRNGPRGAGEPGTGHGPGAAHAAGNVPTIRIYICTECVERAPDGSMRTRSAQDARELLNEANGNEKELFVGNL
jgi:hypothetical protein